MLLGIAITGQARVKRPKSTKDQTRIEIQATEGVVKRKRMKEEETEEKRQRKGSRRHCLKRKARDTKNVSTSGPVDWDTRTQQVPEKARYNTQKVPTQPATTHTLFHTNFFFLFVSSLSLSLFCSSFFFGGQATGVPEWVWHFVTGTESSSSASPLAQLIGRHATNRPTSPHWIEAHVLFDPDGGAAVQALPWSYRRRVMPCHREKKKMPLRLASLFLLAHRPDIPAASDVMAPSQITPSNATTCLLGVFYYAHRAWGSAYIIILCHVCNVGQKYHRISTKKETKKRQKKRNATAAARHPPGSNRGR